MANAYLINAMYGPRPTTPTAGTTESLSDNYTHTQRRSLLAERLYETGSDTATAPVLQDEVDEAGYQPQPWAATGANVLPVGLDSDAKSEFNSLRSMQSPATKEPVKPRDSLELSVERYLPPTGPYYDQFSLSNLLDIDFAKELLRCWSCWRLATDCSKGVACTRVCRVCNTAEHPGLVCPMLYCTLSWFQRRGVGDGTEASKIEARQVRPRYNELQILKTIGIFPQSARNDAPIFPRMKNPIVRQFYRKKGAPRPIKSPIKGDTTTNSNINREGLMRSGSPLSIPVKSEQQATMSLDPRLQGRFAYTTMPIAPSALSDTSSNLSKDRKEQGQDGHEIGPNGDEEIRLQELEDEVLKLKIDNVAKGREIRRLKSENDRLRGVAYDTGSKRPRV